MTTIALVACGTPPRATPAWMEPTPVARPVEIGATAEPVPELEVFVRGLLDDEPLRRCLGGGSIVTEHHLRLGLRRFDYEGRRYEQLEVTDLTNDLTAQNCLNARLARLDQPPATDDVLWFVLTDDPDSPTLGFRTMRTRLGPTTADSVRLERVAGSLGGAGFRDGVGATARFDIPLGLAADDRGHLFVGDSQNRAIREIDPATGRVSTIVTFEERAMTQPTSLAFDARGRLHALDSLKDEIWRIEDGAATRVYRGDVGAFGTARDLSGPRAMVFDADGTALVADSMNHRIVRVDLETGSVTAVAGRFGEPGHRNGKRPLFDLPEGLALGPDRTLYVSEFGSNTIRAVDLDTGRAKTLAGRRGKPGHRDGVGRAARFDAPSSLAYHDGALYVAESHGLVIRRIDLATREVTTIAGAYGRAGSADGAGPDARFGHHESSALGEMPYGMAVADGALFLTDSGNHVVRRIEPGTGAVTTVAGRSVDDALPRPRALARAGGQLYATAGQALVRIDSAGAALVAGDPDAMGHDDGVGRDARFRGPLALASLRDGRLVVGEVNGQVRLVDPDTAEVATLTDFERILNAIAVDGEDRIYAARLFAIERIDRDGNATVAVARRADDHPEAIIVPNLYEPVALALDGDLLYALDRRQLYSGYWGAITTLRRVDLVTGRSDALVTWLDAHTGLTIPAPRGLSVAADGTLWITHSGGALIRFDPDARVDVDVLATAASERGVTLGRNPSVNRPSRTLLDAQGTLLFIDEGAILALRD